MSVEQTKKESKKKSLNVVLMWHMHQPEYRDLRSGQFHQPWTYLHIIKDYVDMVAHLEANPQARAVINFVPVLLEQIDDYRVQLDQYLHQGGAIRDPLLAVLADPVVPHDHEDSLKLIKDCLRANEARLINRFPAYQKLAHLAETVLEDPDTLHYFSEQYISDLVVWYHLAWMGETVRRQDKRIQFLIKKERLYTIHDRKVLIEVIYQLVAGIIGRYRKLAEQGRIELSMTPYAHPIDPLLIDFSSASEAISDITLPGARRYPGGAQRSEWHLQEGLKTFEKFFALRPDGCWPAEGGVSEQTVKQLSAAGFNWFASGETVLRNSLSSSVPDLDHCMHRCYQLEQTNIIGFFRDDGLSDKIGFEYAQWHADDAVANMIHSLEHIANACTNHDTPIVSIILDGENAWESYPDNAYYFLSALYHELAEHKTIKLTTYSEFLHQQQTPHELKTLVAGSWVYGTFSTWIGMMDKNHAWDMLVDAKQVYDEVMQTDQLTQQEKLHARLQLATCESSDWFWWFGDYNPAESVRAFDDQYRMHLCNLYHYLHREPPEYLSHRFSSGSSESSQTGVILPGKQH